ncbi:hypothetical protein [Rathayibacter sp. Leaf299]|uniref:hypothetical protein n=1 Tax=Rathayibacter sp. Leaf299 TaxID=1736328 RepID=UPI0012F7E01C|nr:hypothetical protein [Rathayibacter sp. Leaf299]
MSSPRLSQLAATAANARANRLLFTALNIHDEAEKNQKIEDAAIDLILEHGAKLIHLKMSPKQIEASLAHGAKLAQPDEEATSLLAAAVSGVKRGLGK